MTSQLTIEESDPNREIISPVDLTPVSLAAGSIGRDDLATGESLTFVELGITGPPCKSNHPISYRSKIDV
jgi:hypothetical protein